MKIFSSPKAFYAEHAEISAVKGVAYVVYQLLHEYVLSALLRQMNKDTTDIEIEKLEQHLLFLKNTAWEFQIEFHEEPGDDDMRYRVELTLGGCSPYRYVHQMEFLISDVEHQLILGLFTSAMQLVYWYVDTPNEISMWEACKDVVDLTYFDFNEHDLTVSLREGLSCQGSHAPVNNFGERVEGVHELSWTYFQSGFTSAPAKAFAA